MVYGREGDQIYLHGARASRVMKAMSGGTSTCVSVTLLDGLVVARALFHHSMNYRSVVVLGRPAEVVEVEAKRHALDVISEHAIPGRTSASRRPLETELHATRVVAMSVNEASAKVRSGPPSDEEQDLSLPYWSGVVPLSLTADEPVPDSEHAPTVDVPRHIREWNR